METGKTHQHRITILSVMALMGAFYWAIRGTGGYGGSMGGTLAGFGWGLLWYAFSRTGQGITHRPYGSPWMIAALTAGIAYGGATGYGVYISWLNGKFQYAHGMETRAVGAWTGYAMLFLCGLHWGGNTGCFMSWCERHESFGWKDWILRAASGILGGFLAYGFVRLFPQFFLPFYEEGIYQNEAYDICIRALGSVRNIMPHVGTFLGFLCYEAIRGHKRAVKMILTLALGFAIPFTVGGIWQTFHGSELRLGWWKHWEMTIGFGGGLSMGLAFLWFNRSQEGERPAWGKIGLALFRTRIPLWLPTYLIVRNCWDGWTKIRGMRPTPTQEWIILGFSVALFLAPWIVGKARGREQLSQAEFPISWKTLVALQLVIVLAGWMVTLPLEWHLSSKVIACLYAFYQLTSLACLGLWRWRSSSLMTFGSKS